MYYRRKILLSLLEVFDGKLDKIALQKLLFLISVQQEKNSYYFVPYKLGCFSFQANSDLGTLKKYKQVSETETEWEKTDVKDYFPELKSIDKIAINHVKKHFGSLTRDELIKLTYIKYPYYSIKSTIASQVLNEDDLINVNKQNPLSSKTILFTIGYEGISLEQYLNKLIINDVKVLCDVRKNPLSMKYGFSKTQLSKACTGVGIDYVHIPELGIQSDKRQQLNSQADYDKLFAYYRAGVLKDETEKQKEILILLQEKKRVALTCFEANIYQCHRKHLAQSIANMEGFNHELKHI